MPDVIEVLKNAHRSATPLTPFDLGDSIRRGQRRRRRRRMVNAGAGVVVAAGVAAAAVVLPDGSSELPESAEEATFAILDEPQRKVDELPPAIRRDAGPVDESSTRLVGEYDDLRYWLATNDRGDTCVVAGEGETWLSTGCGGGPWVKQGIRTTGHGVVTAYVFADNLELGIAQHAGFTVISENLAISTISEPEREELAGVLESAAEYLSVFDEPQRRSDQLPDETNRNRPNWPFQEAATRYVGEYRDVRYWIGAREDEPADDYTQVCLIGITVDGEWRGTTCSDPLDVPYELPSRWPLERTDPEDSTRLALVPDDYELTDEEADTWERVAPNLYRETAAS